MKVISDSRVVDFDRTFVLENGEQWQQVPEEFAFEFSRHPPAQVLEDGQGRHFLQVDGFGRSIEVRRATLPPTTRSSTTFDRRET